MAKFVITNSAPQKLSNEEYVVNLPNFLEEVKAATSRTKNNRTNVSELRNIATLIAIKYDQDFDPLRHLKAHAFEGREYNSPEELSSIVIEMLERDYPAIIDRYIEHQLRNRPFGTKLIYFTGPLQKSSIFFKEGIDMIDQKDVEDYMSGKAKRVVGKPAVSNKVSENS